MFELRIPARTPEEIQKRYEKVKPLVRIGDKLHYLREYTPTELTSTSYFWARFKDARDEVSEEEICALPELDFPCLHTFGYQGLFKPSVGEVLSQLSEHALQSANAFEIVEYPETADDLSKNLFTKEALNKGFHVSTVRLYHIAK